MRRFRAPLLAWLTLAVLAALGGCAGRGPSNTGGGGRPSTGTSGPLAALPPPQPDPLGYDLASASVNAVTGGEVRGLAAQPGTADASLVAHAPLAQVASVVSVSVTLETSLPFAIGDLASVGTLAFACTSDPAVAGSADLYRRVETTPGAPAWARVLDTSGSRAALATSANQVLLAVSDAAGQSASLVRLGPASAAVIDSAALGSLRPLAVREYPTGSGTIYVGGADPAGDLALVRLRGGLLETVSVPMGAPAAGLRQEISALEVVRDGAGNELLVVAVAVWDLASGAPSEGAFFLHDGNGTTSLPGLTGDAPTALAWQDQTVVAGSATGRLLLLDPSTGWQDAPGFPGVDRVTRLLARDRRHLLVGCQSASGAVLVIRTGRTP